MKTNAVKFRDKETFNKLKSKDNVVSIHKPYNIIVFADKEEVTPNKSKVSMTVEVNETIPTGIALLFPIDVSKVENFISENNIKKISNLPALKAISVEIPEDVNFDDFKLFLIKSKLFKSVEQDNIVECSSTADVNDFYKLASQWHLQKIKADTAWGIIPGTNICDVAVLDGHGFELDHEDMINAYNLPYNAVDPAKSVMPETDYEKHGTPCAGIIAARTNNEIGVSSIGNNRLRVQPIKIGYNSTSGGSFYTSDLILSNGINAAIANPNCVAISMSFGSTGFRSNFFNAITAARTNGRGGKGIPVFASTGNDGLNGGWTNYPASYSGVIAVGSSTSADTRSSFSNYGANVTISAPGSGIRTIDRTGKKGYSQSGSNDPRVENYTNFSGTSAACPVAAGVGGMMAVANPSITEAQIKQGMASSADKVGGYVYNTETGKSNELGYGRVNLLKSVQFAMNPATASGPQGPTGPQGPQGPTGSTGPVEIKHNFTVTVSIPTTAIVGDTILVNAVVSTNQPQFTPVLVNVNFRWSQDNTLSVDDTILRTETVTLGGGIANVVKQFNFTIPNGTGTKYLFANCDYTNSYSESNESDNIGMDSIEVSLPAPPAGSDIGVEMISLIWGTDGKAKATFRFKNTGSIDITSYQYRKGFSESSSTTSTVSTGLIRPNSYSSTYMISIPATSVTSNTFTIRILSVNGGADTNTVNNIATATFS